MIDAWTGPTPISNQFPANEPNGVRKLLEKIRAVELQVKESTSNLLRTAGIYLSPTGMTIDSNLAITGTLSLPAGIIDNDALANPVVPDAGEASATGFAVSDTATAVASFPLPVPAGFTQALVHVTAAASASNATAFDDLLYVMAAVTPPGGSRVDGPELYGYAAANKWATGSASMAYLLLGLAPGNITVSCMVYAGTNWGTDPMNTANVSASFVFLR